MKSLIEFVTEAKALQLLPPSLPGPETFESAVPEHLNPVSYTHLRAHETLRYLVCRLLLEKKK